MLLLLFVGPGGAAPAVAGELTVLPRSFSATAEVRGFAATAGPRSFTAPTQTRTFDTATGPRPFAATVEDMEDR